MQPTDRRHSISHQDASRDHGCLLASTFIVGAMLGATIVLMVLA